MSTRKPSAKQQLQELLPQLNEEGLRLITQIILYLHKVHSPAKTTNQAHKTLH